MAEVTEEKATGFDVQQKLDKAELFFEKNKKQIFTVGGAAIAIIGGILAYQLWWLPQQNTEAANQLYKSQSLFEKDSFALALKGQNGKATFPSLTEVAENYGSTKSGKLAEYMIGISMLREGKFEDAIEHLENFSSDDILISSLAVGAIGDANMELGKNDEAVKFYLKAADQNVNDFTTPIFLKKAGIVHMENKQYGEALRLFERIKKEYANTTEGREVEKFINRAKTLGNI